MTPFTRGDPPAVLVECADEATASWVARVTVNRSASFAWPVRNGVRVSQAIARRLTELTFGHCCYCDSFPMDGTGEAQLDHFQPKVEFPQLAFAWPNLYLACAACNRAKLDGWSALLVRPDEPGFRFSDFFLVNPSSGELEARPGPNEARARETIRVMHLNRPGLCTLRSDAIKRPNTTVAPESRPYRFLLQARDALG